MRNRPHPILAILVLVGLLGLGGCGYFGGNLEKAVTQEASGDAREAIESYQSYLVLHSSGPLAAHASYRIARNYEALTDYANAIAWYEKTVSRFPGTDEELDSLLGLAALYREKLKDSAKSMEYSQRAFVRSLDQPELRGAVEELVQAQYRSSLAFYAQRDYQRAADRAGNIFQSYPHLFVSPETRARVEALADRSRRAWLIPQVGVDQLVLRKEEPFEGGYEGDFPPLPEIEGSQIPSPDGQYVVERKRSANGTYHLYVAKVPSKGTRATFRRLQATFGAYQPAWSPDSKELVYLRTVGGQRKLERTDIKTQATQTLHWTQGQGLMGIHAAYHPSGSMVAYVYAGQVWLINSSGIVKRWLKNREKLDYTAGLAWSWDGTMLRYWQKDAKNKMVTDNLLILDVSNSSAFP